MTEFKTEIENIIVNFRNKNDYPDSEVEPNKWHIENETEVIDKLIQLFNKHIEDKGDNIAGKIIDHDYDSLSSGETATNIINILKIKE